MPEYNGAARRAAVARVLDKAEGTVSAAACVHAAEEMGAELIAIVDAGARRRT